MHFPYILFACLDIYNQFHSEPERTDLAFTDAFVYQDAIDDRIGTSYTGDIFLAYNTLQLHSANDIFWFKIGMFPNLDMQLLIPNTPTSIVDRLNTLREKRGVSPPLKFNSGPYLHQRALTWDTIYSRFDVQGVFATSPPQLPSNTPKPKPLALVDPQSSNVSGSTLVPPVTDNTQTLPATSGPLVNPQSKTQASVETSRGGRARKSVDGSGNGNVISGHRTGMLISDSIWM